MPHLRKISQYIFSFSYCNFLIIDKQEATNEIFLTNVKLAYDVAMRGNIPVNILFTSLTPHNNDPKILSGWILSKIGKKSVFKRMIQGALKFQGLKDLGHWPLSKCQKFTCTQFVGALYDKLDPCIPKRGKLRKGSNKNSIERY